MSAESAKVLGWVTALVGVGGAVAAATAWGDWWRLGAGVGQALSGAILAAMHFATVRARRRERQTPIQPPEDESVWPFSDRANAVE